MQSVVLSDLDYDTQREVESHDQSYADGLDWRPGRELHDKTVKRVLRYAETGYDANTENVRENEKIDGILDGFMPADEVDEIRKMDDPRKPVNVVMGMLYSHLGIFLTGMHRAFFSGPAFHRYEGASTPIRAAKAALAENLVARIGGWFGERDAFDIHCGNGFSHGRAFMWGKWSKKTAPKIVDEELGEDEAMLLQSMGYDVQPGDPIRYTDEEDEIRAEGTEWIPLDPYQVLPDPGTQAGKIQDASFFGWVADTDALLLLTMESDPEEQLFNCEALEILSRKRRAESNCWRETDAMSRKKENRPDRGDDHETTRCHVIYMFIRLIPKQWGLSDATRPQWWFFAVGGDRILIKAHRVMGDLPIVECAPNRRGHQISPPSNLSMCLGKQYAIDFLVKQDLDCQDLLRNGKFIFNPRYLDWTRFSQGCGPMGIPMKREAQNKNISDIYHQVDVQNYTSENWNKVSNLLGLARDVDGINEPLSALPERTTATGVEAINNQNFGRMARSAVIIDEQSRIPMARQHLQNIKQWMSTGAIMGITGRYDQIIRQGYGLPPEATGLMVESWDIDPSLEVMSLGAMSNQSNFSAKTEFFKSIAGLPGVAETLLNGTYIEEFLFSYFREMGLSDIDHRRVNVLPEVPDEALRAAWEKGDMVPMREVAQEVAR
jgi:hypothetical protein